MFKKIQNLPSLLSLCCLYPTVVVELFFFIVKDQFCFSKFFFLFKGKKGVTVTLTLVDQSSLGTPDLLFVNADAKSANHQFDKSVNGSNSMYLGL